jgi:hypothetical protein
VKLASRDPNGFIASKYLLAPETLKIWQMLQAGKIL